MKKIVLVFIGLWLAGCATVHEGNLAKVNHGDTIPGLNISAVENTDPFGNPFSLFVVTFENNTTDWIRFDSIEIEMDGETAQKISVVLGQDLRDWATASEEKMKLERHNEDMARLGLVGAGAVAAGIGAANGDSNLATAGVGVVGVGYAWALSDAISTSRANAMNPKIIPDSHLYHPFSVPGTLFTRRWVLLNKPATKRVSVLALKLHTVDGRESHISVKIN